MHPHHHSMTSVKIWGGKIEDYAHIHDWFDATKESFGDCRHRALRHHSQGIFECERIFGRVIVNSDGREVPVRYIGEQHVKEDCGGRIPTVADWFRNIKIEAWMNRGYKVERETQSKYVVRNHNNTLLGEFDNEQDAQKEAAFYMNMTGNIAAVFRKEMQS